MYYLLENNKIIDIEDLKRTLPSVAKIEVLDNKLKVTLEGIPILTNNKIKRQSPIITDLLEKLT